VNSPKGVKAANYQRDGAMRVDDNGAGNPNYYPNSFNGPEPQPEMAEPAVEYAGKAARQPHTHPNDDFVQAGALYSKVMKDMDRDHLIGNIVDHLGNAQKRIQLRQTALFYKAHPEYGSRVAQGLKLDVKEVERLAKMTQEERAKATA
jgi:catalase